MSAENTPKVAVVPYKTKKERVILRTNKQLILFVATTVITLAGTLLTKWATGEFPDAHAFALAGGALIIQSCLAIVEKAATTE